MHQKRTKVRFDCSHIILPIQKDGMLSQVGNMPGFKRHGCLIAIGCGPSLGNHVNAQQAGKYDEDSSSNAITISFETLYEDGFPVWHLPFTLLMKVYPLPWTNDQVTLRDGMHNIGAADDPYQFAILYNRDTLDLALREQQSNLIDGCLLVDDKQLVTHNVSNT